MSEEFDRISSCRLSSGPSHEWRLGSLLGLLRSFRLMLVVMCGIMEIVVSVGTAADSRRTLADLVLMMGAVPLAFGVGYALTVLYFALRIDILLLRLSRSKQRVRNADVWSRLEKHIRWSRPLHSVLCRVLGISLPSLLAAVSPGQDEAISGGGKVDRAK